jgi:hypothetical protein
LRGRQIKEWTKEGRVGASKERDAGKGKDRKCGNKVGETFEREHEMERQKDRSLRERQRKQRKEWQWKVKDSIQERKGRKTG